MSVQSSRSRKRKINKRGNVRHSVAAVQETARRVVVVGRVVEQTHTSAPLQVAARRRITPNVLRGAGFDLMVVTGTALASQGGAPAPQACIIGGALGLLALSILLSTEDGSLPAMFAVMLVLSFFGFRTVGIARIEEGHGV